VKQVIVYTDGACSGNPGPGGWAAILLYGKLKKEISGAVPLTTNNRMEMQAALEALNALREPCQVLVHSDSAYLVNAFNNGWIKNWIKRDWKKADKKPVENQDLWMLLIAAAQNHEVQWIKVKGHSDNELNNLVDGLAVAAILTLKETA
jgi:ribonuclease HI